MSSRTISHYQILSKLGTGGMGEVYLAEDTKLNRKVALKLLPSESIKDEQARRRLLREAQAAAALDHPNICSIHEVNEVDGQSFIAMQYVEGELLSNRIREKPLPLNEALDIAVQVADALAAAHSRGIIHRDIKPQNIIITPRGQVKVLDFGLAKVNTDNHETSQLETDTWLTGRGMVIGTVPYMSPEQLNGENLDGRSDIFSFGVLLYETISGSNPFKASGVGSIISKILMEDPEPLSAHAEVPEELQRIVERCLAKHRDERYGSSADLLSDLRDLQQANSTTVSSPHWPKVHRRVKPRWIQAAVALAVLVVLLFALYSFYNRTKATEPTIRSLAVLPFSYTGPAGDAEYLSDGMTESLINSFSQLPQLKVIARTTSFRYKAREIDAQTIGRELRVDAIVTGRVTQQGDTLIVQADLLNTADGSQTWGERYNRKISDIFSLQEQIATEIAGKLRLRLTGEEKQGLSKRYTSNVRAYQNYLQGHANSQRRTREDLLTAVSYFEKAIAEDANYALAYAGLAEAYAGLGARGYIDPDEARRKLEDAARTSLSLDENLADAHIAIAQTKVRFAPYDFAGGDRELRRAIELSPSLASAHHFLGLSLHQQGRIDESLQEWQLARELDPLSLPVARNVAYGSLLRRDYPRALELLRQSAELGPSFVYSFEIEIYLKNELYDEALVELEKAKKERPGDAILVFSTGMVYAAQKKRVEALNIVRELEQMAGPTLHRAQSIALIYAALDEKELALDWLKRGLDARAIWVFHKDSPAWDPIRDDQRFKELIQKMGIPT